MKYFNLLIFSILCLTSYAQKPELKVLCAGIEDLYKQTKPLHLEYTMTMVGTGMSPGTEHISVNIFKDDKKVKMKMGQAQDIVQDNGIVIMANHIQKLIMVSVDTGKSVSPDLLLGDLTELIDSAASIDVKKDKGLTTYTLRFGNDFVYTLLKMRFSDKTKHVDMIYSEFSPMYPEPYYSLQVDYKKWDLDWKPEHNFPNMKDFVSKQANGKYIPAGIYTKYEIFQPEKQRINPQ